ncbi:Protein CBR-SYDN-1 [Caenorhabditis briggsae]|uniref:Protein CBR-SYDN-1 n=1 Tax=Caenorhabditis briggsae TaxID=6238 RepID=A8WVW4_CAEBR|nr:Protein CBR-SYDN-1 [Caenorhabditis briggsae]CAP24777.2 Protein CBR-SYDN-1 [Caenorhabditis briggsae]
MEEPSTNPNNIVHAEPGSSEAKRRSISGHPGRPVLPPPPPAEAHFHRKRPRSTHHPTPNPKAPRKETDLVDRIWHEIDEEQREKLARKKEKKEQPAHSPRDYLPLTASNLRNFKDEDESIRDFIHRQGMVDRLLGYKMLFGRMENCVTLGYEKMADDEITELSAKWRKMFFPGEDPPEQKCPKVEPSSLPEDEDFKPIKKGPRTPPGSPGDSKPANQNAVSRFELIEQLAKNFGISPQKVEKTLGSGLDKALEDCSKKIKNELLETFKEQLLSQYDRKPTTDDLSDQMELVSEDSLSVDLAMVKKEEPNTDFSLYQMAVPPPPIPPKIQPAYAYYPPHVPPCAPAGPSLYPQYPPPPAPPSHAQSYQQSIMSYVSPNRLILFTDASSASSTTSVDTKWTSTTNALSNATGSEFPAASTGTCQHYDAPASEYPTASNRCSNRYSYTTAITSWQELKETNRAYPNTCFSAAPPLPTGMPPPPIPTQVPPPPLPPQMAAAPPPPLPPPAPPAAYSGDCWRSAPTAPSVPPPPTNSVEAWQQHVPPVAPAGVSVSSAPSVVNVQSTLFSALGLHKFPPPPPPPPVNGNNSAAIAPPPLPFASLSGPPPPPPPPVAAGPASTCPLTFVPPPPPPNQQSNNINFSSPSSGYRRNSFNTGQVIYNIFIILSICNAFPESCQPYRFYLKVTSDFYTFFS